MGLRLREYCDDHCDDLASDVDVDVPAWIDSDITVGAVAAIHEGGCASGAYMPAVTYHTALATMAEHGDDVLNYLDDVDLGGPGRDSWSGLACRYLSLAVELWAAAAMSEIEDYAVSPQWCDDA